MADNTEVTTPSNADRCIKFLPTKPFKHLKLLIVVILHWLVVLGNFSAFFILMVQGLTPGYGLPWYVCLPLCSFIMLISFSRVLDCPMTRYENKLRVQVGRPTIKGFIGHYFLKPYIRAKVKRKREQRRSSSK